MNRTLVIVPCGVAKIWDKEQHRGPTPAREAYVGAPFKVNREYAERFGDRWVILSAKYGLIDPDFLIPGPYNVTFKRKSPELVTIATLRRQIESLKLDSFATIIALGGKEYRGVLEEAFANARSQLHFPFAGLPIGKSMQAMRRALANGRALPSPIALPTIGT